MKKPTTDELIKLLGLQPLPAEGGYFSVTYTSDERIQADALPERYNNARSLGGAIYFLETTEQFSAMHKLPTDELYYHHLGDPLEMLFLYPDGSGEKRILGPDLMAGQQLQIVALRHCWHGSRPLPGGNNGFTLVSTSMAPGFDESDSIFANRDELIRLYPDFSSLVESLTRIKSHNI